MDPARFANAQLGGRAYRAGSDRLAATPQELFLEVAARCNLRCRMCAINYDSRYFPTSGRPGLLQPELFERLQTIFPTLLRAHLYGLGEPLLNPHLLDYVRRLTAAGAETRFTTNATLIDDDTAEAIARAGTDRVSVSIDGATAETYEAIRRGASFADLTRGLDSLAKARRRFGKPMLTVNFVAMASNFEELPALIDLCAEASVERVNVEPLFHWGATSPDLAEHYRRESLGATSEAAATPILDEAARRAEAAGIGLSSRFLTGHGTMDYTERVTRETGPRWSCSEPWATVYVTTAGEVRPCCLNDLVLGRLTETPFEEIWNGETYRRFRRQHAVAEAGGDEAENGCAEGCASCYENGRVRHNPLFEAVEPVSYRPLAALAPEPPAAFAVDLEGPTADEVVGDPIVVTGHLPFFFRQRALSSVHVNLDRTPVASLADASLQGDRFVLAIPVPYLSEGAHLLSLSLGGSEAGWSRRRVHFWRPPVDGDALGSRLLLRGAGSHLRPLAATVGASRVPIVDWLCGRRPEGWLAAVRLDLAGLPAGRHQIQLTLAGGAIRTLETFVPPPQVV